MYMNLKPNQHKRISFNPTTMTSMGFIGLPLNLAPPQIKFFAQVPPYFGLKFLCPPKMGEGAATMSLVAEVTIKVNVMKAEFQNSARRLSVLCHLLDVKVGYIKTCLKLSEN